MISKFLPDAFDGGRGVCLIAGRGAYPKLMHESLVRYGIGHKLIGFEGETPLELFNEFLEGDRVMIKVGQLGKMLKYLKRFGVGYGVMAGQIRPKRLFRGLRPDLRAALILARLKVRNAESIFGAIGEEIEKIGVKLLDARCFMDGDIVGKGVLCGRFDVEDPYFLHGVKMVKAVAELDIGQSVVVRKGTVLLVEGFDGTDAMIERAGEFDAKEKIFIKGSKPKQDFRFDVPVFGPQTVKSLGKAGILHVGLEAGKTIILDKAYCVKLANSFGINIVGF